MNAEERGVIVIFIFCENVLWRNGTLRLTKNIVIKCVDDINFLSQYFYVLAAFEVYNFRQRLADNYDIVIAREISDRVYFDPMQNSHFWPKKEVLQFLFLFFAKKWKSRCFRELDLRSHYFCTFRGCTCSKSWIEPEFPSFWACFYDYKPNSIIRL